MSNIPQTILSKTLTELAYITKANGYQRDFASPVKGLIPFSVNNKNWQSCFELGNSDVVEPSEDYSKGKIQTDLIINVHYQITEGNLIDECEIILQDLIDWFIGTKGTGKCSTLPNSIDGLNYSYIKKHFRVFDANNKTGGTCGMQILINYNDSI